jgi:hypothetical protein
MDQFSGNCWVKYIFHWEISLAKRVVISNEGKLECLALPFQK